LPNGGIKKYVSLVCGLIIMLLIMNPILHFLKSDFNFEEKFKTIMDSTKKNAVIDIDDKAKALSDIRERQTNVLSHSQGNQEGEHAKVKSFAK